MSLVLTASPKDCSKKGLNINKINKKLLYLISTLILSLLSIVFLIWVILHPSKPEFYLRDTAVSELSLAAPRLLNSTIQTTIVSKNPNTRVGIYYDGLRAFAVYKGQQITEDSELPPFYQDHQDSNLVSTSLYGPGMPVAPSFGYEVSRDQTAGKMFLRLKLEGQIRWKVGAWVSGRYKFNVDCVVLVALRAGDDAIIRPVSSVQSSQCSTSL